MAHFTQDDLDTLKYLCKNRKVEATYNSSAGYCRVRDGKAYLQIDDLHGLDDDCGDCWSRIDLREERQNLDAEACDSDGDSD